MSTTSEWDCFHKCPVCGAAKGEPCRTPKGRKKDEAHDVRPFSITSTGAKSVCGEVIGPRGHPDDCYYCNIARNAEGKQHGAL